MIEFGRLLGPMKELRSLASLDDGWHFGSGLRPTFAAQLNARALTLIASNAGASKFEYFPEEDGGILVIAYRGANSAEILATADGSYELAFEDDEGLSPAENMATIGEVQTNLEQRGWQSQKSSDSFTRVLTVSEKTDTHRWHFDPEVTVQFQSSIPAALLQKGIRAVPMRSVITRDESAAPQQYFGASKRLNLLQAAS